MMNKKILLLLIPLLIFVNSLSAGTKVEKIVYHTGEDFVQLFFKTDGIVPIPDLFYPDKENSKHLVMRVADIDFLKKKKSYSFDSPIIKDLFIKKQKNYYDIEINLKEVVNYRVFTSANGLFVEFPNIKKIDSAIVKHSQKKPVKKKKSVFAKPEQSHAQYTALSKGRSSGNRIKGFEVNRMSPEHVKFTFYMTKKAVNHKVIEVNNKPYRLAIDLKNIRSKRIAKQIGHFNVKKLRGSPNSPEVFRLVFDLSALKKYKVSANENRLEVDFFNKLPVSKAIVKASPKPKKKLNETKTLEIAKTKPAIKKDPVLSKNTAYKPLFNDSEKKQIAKQSKKISLKSKNKLDDAFFTEPKSETSKNDSTNFLEVVDDEGNKVRGTITVAGGEPKYKGAPMDINVKNQDLANLINTFSDLAKINIILDPGVSGKVTANLKKVPWDQALDLFLKINQLGKVVEGNILRIGKLSVLAKEAKQQQELALAKATAEELIVKNYTASYAKAKELDKLIQSQLSPRGKTYIDERTNTVIVTDIAEKIKVIDNLVNILDAPTPQVSIEAKIVETNVNYYNALGIQWGYHLVGDAAHGNQTSLKFPNNYGVAGNVINDNTAPGVQHPNGLGGYAINLPAPVFSTATAFTVGNVANTFRLDLALTAMENDGKGKILSAPKTTTQNNLNAKIAQGSKIPLQTNQNNTIQVRYVDAVLELDVTPQITAKGTIKMELKIKNDNPDWANEVGGIPPLSTQSLNTTIMANDGETIVIGGMYKIESSVNENRVPFLSRLPIIGTLFKSKLKTGSRKEILIFVTPRIVK